MSKVNARNERRRLENKVKYEGLRFETANGTCEVVEYVNNESVKVRFVETGYEKDVWLKSVKTGNIRDCTAPTLFGVGVVGETNLKTKGNDAKEYTLWKNMLKRCYDFNYKKDFPSYSLATTTESFRYFVKFVYWCNKQVGFNEKDDKGRPFHLDKDILIKGNKLYSEDTCCFVPPEINGLFTKADRKRGNYPVGVSFNKGKGKFEVYCWNNNTRYLGSYATVEEAFYVYKTTKESHIKLLAEKWKDNIDPRIYEALINYQVEITD